VICLQPASLSPQELEKDPLAEVPREPCELLDKTRYMRSSRNLGAAKEADVAHLIHKISQFCEKRGLVVKPYFDDAAQDDNSSKLYGHVTATQFKQCLDVKLGLSISNSEASLCHTVCHPARACVQYVAYGGIHHNCCHGSSPVLPVSSETADFHGRSTPRLPLCLCLCAATGCMMYSIAGCFWVYITAPECSTAAVTQALQVPLCCCPVLLYDGDCTISRSP
jgi:hypothetical protein